MEFEEVNNYIKLGHVHPGSLPSTALPWHPAFVAAPSTATPAIVDTFEAAAIRGSGNSQYHRQHHHHHHHHHHRRRRASSPRRPNPIPGVSRLVNSVRRFKKPKETWHITVSPMGSPPPQPPPAASSGTTTSYSPPIHPLTSLQEIKCQMQNFVVPPDWHPTSGAHASHDSESCQPPTGSRLVTQLKDTIARFEYLIHIEQQRITSCRADIVGYMGKLKQLDNDTHQINTRLTLERLERTSAMYDTLRSVNNRIPRLEQLRDRQKRTATKVEGYIKSGNLDKRLRMLEMQTRTTRLEAIWAQLRQWGPAMTLISLAMFIILLILFSS